MTIFDNPIKVFIDLCPMSLRFNILKPLFLKKALSRLKPNFMWSLHVMLGWKFIQMFRVTWPRWLPGPYMVKNFKHLILQNQETDDLETWYTAPNTQVLPNLFKWWHWVDLDHFMTCPNLFPNASAWVKAQAFEVGSQNYQTLINQVSYLQ